MKENVRLAVEYARSVQSANEWKQRAQEKLNNQSEKGRMITLWGCPDETTFLRKMAAQADIECSIERLFELSPKLFNLAEKIVRHNDLAIAIDIAKLQAGVKPTTVHVQIKLDRSSHEAQIDCLVKMLDAQYKRMEREIKPKAKKRKIKWTRSK